MSEQGKRKYDSDGKAMVGEFMCMYVCKLNDVCVVCVCVSEFMCVCLCMCVICCVHVVRACGHKGVCGCRCSCMRVRECMVVVLEVA